MSKEKILKQITLSKGMGLIEVLVGATVVSLILLSVVGVLQLYLVASRNNVERVQASYILEEGVEAIRFLRDEGWSANIDMLSIDTEYGLSFDAVNNVWEATTTQVEVNGFKRVFMLSEVYRKNSDSDIVASSSAFASTLDINTKKALVTVLWGSGGTKESIVYEDGVVDADIPGSQFPNDNGWGDPAQSFTVSSVDIVVPSVELYLRSTGTPSDIYVEIRDTPDGAVLAVSDTVDSSVVVSSTELAWISFSFTTPPSLTADTKYYIRLRSTPESTVAFSGAQGSLHWGYGFPGESVGGEAYRFVGAGTQTLTDYDFSFRVIQNIQNSKLIDAITYITNLFSN